MAQYQIPDGTLRSLYRRGNVRAVDTPQGRVLLYETRMIPSGWQTGHGFLDRLLERIPLLNRPRHATIVYGVMEGDARVPQSADDVPVLYKPLVVSTIVGPRQQKEIKDAMRAAGCKGSIHYHNG
ncbi:MAG: hypothetical protein HYY37_04605 [Candidatus Aenigmarchaeota archaeon]|nr:hypothetical protein [Candidatus Aenigmarchaeota archaeon]